MKGQKRETRGGVVTDIKLGCVKKERESTGKEQATPLLGGNPKRKESRKWKGKKSLSQRMWNEKKRNSNEEAKENKRTG